MRLLRKKLGVYFGINRASVKDQVKASFLFYSNTPRFKNWPRRFENWTWRVEGKKCDFNKLNVNLKPKNLSIYFSKLSKSLPWTFKPIHTNTRKITKWINSQLDI